MKDLRNTFVRINNEQHYNDVVRAYKIAGAKPFANPFEYTGDAYLEVDSKLNISRTWEIENKQSTELILKNGELIMKEKNIDWGNTYVKVSTKEEYNLAWKAYVKLCDVENDPSSQVPLIPGVLGIFKTTKTDFICSQSVLASAYENSQEIPLSTLLSAAKLNEEPKVNLKEKWERRYVKVNNEEEYKLAIAAYQKVTGFGAGSYEKYNSFLLLVGVWNELIFSFYKESDFNEPKSTEATLSELLKDANMKQSKSRRTKIEYEETENSVKITKIENVLTKEEAERLAPGYTKISPFYYADGNKLIINNIDGCNIVWKNGITVHKEHLELLVKIMKDAGDRFVELRKKTKVVKKSVEI